MSVRDERHEPGSAQRKAGANVSAANPVFRAPARRTLADRLGRGAARAVVCFAGQGTASLDEIVRVLAEDPAVQPWVHAAAAAIERAVQHEAFVSSGLYGEGFDLLAWVHDESARPDTRYLASSVVSQPLILVAQVCRYVASWRAGFGAAFAGGGVAALTGHSQGVLAALMAAERADGFIEPKRLGEYVEMVCWQALHMAQSSAAGPHGAFPEGGTPMAAIAGPTAEVVTAEVDALNALLPSEQRLHVTLFNTRTRHVVSGPVDALEALRARLAQRAERELALRKQGRFAGRPLHFTWEYVPVERPYHSEHMRAGLEAMLETVRELGFRIEASSLHLPVYNPAHGHTFNEQDDPVVDLLTSEFVRPVHWWTTLLHVAGQVEPNYLVDFGPGEAVARLAASALRGTGVRVVAAATDAGQAELFSAGAAPGPALRYADLAPALVELPDGTRALDNRFARLTGCPPVFLPGMTPTTADVPIVAAAANAGYLAELAGGGQVTEAIFERRLEELTRALEPGRQVVFNALYLDPYLWDLHVRRAGLVLRARKRGAPIRGITISAGMPEPDEAVRLVESFLEAGMDLVAVKPGTVDQVRQALKIARAVAPHPLFVHIEGGKAGGHHSWEDLEDILLETYHLLRETPNVVVCVGGGVGTPARAADLLTGAWSTRHGLPPMPADAVFLGTVAMAAAEAGTSPAVKEALVRAAGSTDWPLRGEARGGVTSGLSSLDADIYYLDNAAARAARLLDEVAGDAEAVARRRDEIVAALDATARPYFGDLDRMTWYEVLERMVDLMAVGRGGPYEDGPWPDRSYRERVADMLRRAEARLAREPVVDSVLRDLAELDDPRAVLERFAARWPASREVRLHPADVDFFVRQVCARPGKPVNFVPVLDANVRKWFKADALWHAHDPRWPADQVLAIPGPEAVAGIERADEPIAEMLGRFERAVVDAVAMHRAPRRVDRRARVARPPLPVGVVARATTRGVRLHIAQATGDPTAWLPWVAAGHSGPLAAFAGARVVQVGTRWVPNPLRRFGRAQPGDVVDLRVGRGGRLEQLRWRPAGAREGEEAICSLDDAGETVELALHAPRLGGGAAVLRWHWKWLAHAESFRAEPAEVNAAQAALFAWAIGGAAPNALAEPVALFEEAEATSTPGSARIRAMGAWAGDFAGNPTGALSMTLAGPAVARVLAAPELAGGLLDLLHAHWDFEPGPAWPPVPGEEVAARAAVVEVEDTDAGRRVRVRGELRVARGLLGRLDTGFALLGHGGDAPWRLRRRERVHVVLDVAGEAERRFLDELRWVDAAALAEASLPLRLEADVDLEHEVLRDGSARARARGVLRGPHGIRCSVDLDAPLASDARHPVDVLAELLGPRREPRPTAPRTLARLTARAPRSMDGWARAGGDLNPLHRGPLFARLAGLDGPIAHGMWTAARMEAVAAEVAGGPQRVASRRVDFLAPLPVGSPIEITVRRTGVRAGGRFVEVTASRPANSGAVEVARGRFTLAPPRTAYAFPGQGIQQPGMGMDGYARSRAARRIWDRADAYTREALGFSILRVVRDNPPFLDTAHGRFRHPRGVLHLTQFTQVAMAVLARAQVEELREAEVFVEGAVTCGHSVGEYNALGAVAGVVPFESVLSIVWQRGMVMHDLVERDASGESGYRMGVIRPHHAGLDHEQMETLVERIANETGAFLQIVNFNVRGRQYAVTGQLPAIEALAAELQRRQRGKKPAWVEVPGIDVPFHSRVLRHGVDSFRQALDALLPHSVDPDRLVGRYIPNLVARVFELTPPFAESILEVVPSERVREVLAHWDEWTARPGALARELLLELLAWQFASPVRWIETQELLLRPASAGGLGIERFVEVGVGYQPTLRNMAGQSLAVLGPAAAPVEVLNAEADAERVFERDEDPPVEDAAPPGEPEATPAPAPAEQGAQPAPSHAPAAPEPAVPGAEPPPDRPLEVAEALRALVAFAARVRPDQLDDGETIDDVFEGVSSRRNQVLGELADEFEPGTLDAAHERPLGELATEVARRARAWRGPRKVLKAHIDEALAGALGPAGLGSAGAVRKLLEAEWGLGPGWQDRVLVAFALETREGPSARGGELGELAGARATSRQGALDLLDKVVQLVARQAGVALPRRGAGGPAGAAGRAAAGGVVDRAAVDELERKILGEDGVLAQSLRDVAARLGLRLEPEAGGEATAGELAEALRAWEAEHGADYLELVSPRFDARKHVAITSWWAFARRDVAETLYDALDGRLAEAAVRERAARLRAAAQASSEVAATAAWAAAQARAAGREDLATLFEEVAKGGAAAPCPVVPSRPRLVERPDGTLAVREERDEAPDALERFARALTEGEAPAVRAQGSVPLAEWLRRAARAPLDVAGKVALVTGASPGSIAVEIVRHLLAGGARVVVTTTQPTPERRRFYRRLYQEAAGPGAELHVVPFNQASLRDVDALVDWLFSEVTEQAGGVVRRLKEPMRPNLVIPFGAMPDVATADGLGGRSLAVLRAMLVGVERLVAAIGARLLRDGEASRPVHVLLPLSPNHGDFGGDGAYAETKAALEVLARKVRSEREAWGGGVTLCAARIGWVRSTGLMEANDVVAPLLEERHGVRTFSSAEMGWLLAALCTPEAAEAARKAPLWVDLTGGMDRVGGLRDAVGALRAEVEERVRQGRRLEALRTQYAEHAREPAGEAPAVRALPPWPRPLVDPASYGRTLPWPKHDTRLEEMVVIVGAAELGPCGSSRTRFELEVFDRLSPPAVLELAWTTGLVRWEDDGRGGRWVDTATGEPVDEADLGERYEEEVRKRVGIRRIAPETAGFDPEALPVYARVYLDRDFTFRVGSREEAEGFVRADPEHTSMRPDEGGDGWWVTRRAGAEVRVLRHARLDRNVAGLVPDGFDFARYGIPPDMLEQVDRVALFNLVATVDAFVSAGIEPEELLAAIHPARIGNTQGSGIGGMRSLRRLYLDHLLGQPRQADMLQETLINVIAAYVVQSYVGSYGAMVHPVGACATAAVSLEEAFDKLRAGRADFVVAGAFDDVGPEGMLGFADMAATASSDEMGAMGIPPAEMSRPNDRRRRGFVEGQGGGTLLVTRGDIARDLGLPVLAVLGWAGSFADGVQRSIPAPGIGAVAAARGGRRSPLAEALARYGLGPDDVAIASKHDTSTAANDVNENALHDQLATALGRTDGAPLHVVSQKSLTGHAKGGAAAWQVVGLAQAMLEGVVPGNRNLESVDEAMRRFRHLCFSDRALRRPEALPIRAGLVTSLGFGHVNAVVLLVHPDAFVAALSEGERRAWLARAHERLEEGRRRWARIWMGQRAAYVRRTERRLRRDEDEAAVLLDPAARLDPRRGVFVHEEGGGSA